MTVTKSITYVDVNFLTEFGARHCVFLLLPHVDAISGEHNLRSNWGHLTANFPTSEHQIRRGIEDNSKIIFFYF